MIKSPLKQANLLNVLRDVEKVVVKMPKFTLADGEKPEHTMEYILDVLGQLQQKCVVLMDDIRDGKDFGG